MSDTDFVTATTGLYRLPGVAGLLLQKGRNLLANHLPFAPVQTEQFSQTVSSMSAAYKEARRPLRRAYMAYDGGNVLILFQEEVQCCFILTSRADLEQISHAGSSFLQEHLAALEAAPWERQQGEGSARPDGTRESFARGSAALDQQQRFATPPPAQELNRWADVRKAVEATLGKVMARGQAGRMIDRCLQEQGIADPFTLSKARSKEVAGLILEQIPNRSRRASLLTELNHAFDELKL